MGGKAAPESQVNLRLEKREGIPVYEEKAGLHSRKNRMSSWFLLEMFCNSTGRSTYI